ATQINSAAAGFRVDRSLDIVEMNIAAAALRVQLSLDPGGFNISAFGFDLDLFNFTRHGDHEVAREVASSATLPIAFDCCCIATARGGDLVGIELAARFLFRRCT